MFKTTNSFTLSESTIESLKTLGKVLLTVAAGFVLARFGVRLPDNIKP